MLLQLRRGVTADDQGTLFAAEQRARAVGGLRVGQMPTAFAAAFYSPTQKFYPRITRVIEGPAYVIHTNPNMANRFCTEFNRKSTRRQMWMSNSTTIGRLDSVAQCRLELEMKKCPFAGDGTKALSAGAVVFEPKIMEAPEALQLHW